MRDSFQLRLESLQTRIAARAAARGATPAVLNIAAFAVSLLALPVIARQYYAAGFAVFLLGGLVMVLAATEDRGRIFDGVVYASVPFAFALADPTRALAACFLLFGFVAVCSVSEKRVRVTDTSICTIAYAIACFVPSWFGLIAYGLGIACFVVTGIRLTRRPA